MLRAGGNLGISLVLSLLSGFVAGTALAKLPPPTPEEKARSEKAAADKAAAEKKQKQELEAKQDEIARRYHARHPSDGKEKP